MKKMVLLILCIACLTAIAACSGREEAEHEITPESTTSVPTPKLDETPQPSAEPIETVEIYSARMWNEFAESYNLEREKYADYITINISHEIDFENTEFVPLEDGFSGEIIGCDPELTGDERQGWVNERKKWPLDYMGTFSNIRRIKNIDGKNATSLFGSVDKLELKNVSFAFIYIDGVECLFTENADLLKMDNVKVQNCTLPDGRSIAAVNVGTISAEGFIAESCMLTGYEYMGGIACFVSGDAHFKDIFLCRCSFTLSPDNGGSGLWSSGVGLLSKSVSGTASFENIDIYGCNSTGLYTDALTNSIGEASKCSDISLDFCTFINYRPMTSEYRAGIIGRCGETALMDMPVFEEKVSITNCNIGGEFVEADFENREYNVKNCIFTSNKEEPPQ